MSRQGKSLGPHREIVKKVRDPNGFVIEELLSCGHRIDEEGLRALGRSQARCDRQRQQKRCCPHCRENLADNVGMSNVVMTTGEGLGT